MADKNSFLVYKDIDIEGLDDNQLGQLFRAMLDYANEREVEIEDPEVRGLWRAVKRQMRANDESYENTCKGRAKAGKAGADKRWGSHPEDSKAKQSMAKMANAIFAKNEIAKMADTDTDKDTDTDTDIPPKAPQPAIQPKNLIDGNAVIPQFTDQTMGKEFLTWLDIRMEVGPFPYGAFTAAMSEAKAAEKKYGPEKCIPMIKKAQSGGWKRIPWEDLDRQETTRSGTTTTPKKNGWSNIQNNEYDFDQLEKALLGTG